MVEYPMLTVNQAVCSAQCHTSEGMSLVETALDRSFQSSEQGRYGLSEKASDYIVPEAIFLPVLRIFIQEKAQWNGGIRQGQRGVTIFTYGSMLGGCTGVFCRELGLELHFRLNDDCSVFKAEILAILKAIEAIAGDTVSDSESYIIFFDSQAALKAIASVWCKSRICLYLVIGHSVILGNETADTLVFLEAIYQLVLNTQPDIFESLNSVPRADIKALHRFIRNLG